ncbi:MAG: hypothetical protein ACM3ML_38960, partial [Micromonosporaceae bacterium]
RESGADPMAIRLAILAHHYRSDWEWTDAVLAEAQSRLARWRAAASYPSPAASYPSPAASSPSPAAVPAAAAASAPAAPALSAASPAVTPPAGVPAAEAVLQAVRERLADDLDAPGALAAIDAWADAVLAAPPGSGAPAGARLIRDTADALLGVAL